MYIYIHILYIYNYISIPLEPYFKGFYWGISNIFHGVYLTYTPSHRVLIHLKGLTDNYIWFKPQSVDEHQKQPVEPPTSHWYVANSKRIIALWDRRQLNST